ncbi:MAG: site-2 protease family protein [Candidatus Taylorbacteria bacterium]|nr:site-2 protease family protein [Candidatus Taylorbacteria bacterium]
MNPDLIFSLLLLLISVVAHEVAHGIVALWCGDPTAKLAGRLTANPLKHIEVFGSIIVPILTGLAGMPFGWAKPVPVNPYNFKNRRWGELFVSSAGIIVNFAIALVFGLIIRFGGTSLPVSFIHISAIVVAINVTLILLNILPIPPLDGSRILFALLPERLRYIQEAFERYSLVIAVIVLIVVWRFVEPFAPLLFNFLTGLSA